MSEDYNIAEEIFSIIDDFKQGNISGDNEEEENEEETFNSNFNNNLNEEDNNNFDDNYEDNVEDNIEEEEDNPNFKKIGKPPNLLAESTTDSEIQCSECGKYYTTQKIFKHRKRIHKLPRFICKFCKVESLTEDDYKRHLLVVHPESGHCSECNKLFLDRDKYALHVEYKHKFFSLGQKFECFQCTVPEFTKKKEFHEHLETEHFEEVWCKGCERRFPHPRVLSNHLKRGHNKNSTVKESTVKKSKVEKSTEINLRKFSVPKLRNYNVKCPVCELNCNFHPELLRHLRVEHGMDIVEKETTFRTISEFNRWRFETEKRTKSYFIHEKTYRQTNGTMVEHYYCNRSGIHNPKKGSNPNGAKFGQSKKINATCPARIVSYQAANEIKVRYILEHVGHQCELKHLPLSNFELRKVEEMFHSGMTVNQTYEACRNLKPQSDQVRHDTVERLNVIDKYTVRYIANKLRKTSKVAIAYYRPPGDNSSAKSRKRKKPSTNVGNNQVECPSRNVSTTTVTNTAAISNHQNNNVFDITNQIPSHEIEITDGGEESDISTETAPSSGSTISIFSHHSSVNGDYSSDDNSDDDRMDIDGFNDNEVVPLTTTVVPIITSFTSAFQIPDKSLIIDFPASSLAAPAILEPHSFSAFEVPPGSSGGDGSNVHHDHHRELQQQEDNAILDYFINYWNRCDLEKRLKISKTLQPKFDEHKRRLTEKTRTKPITATTTTGPRTRSQF